MARTITRATKPVKMVKVVCVDNGKTIEAELIEQFPDRITVELIGGLRLTLRQHRVQKMMFVASHSGMEFQCNLKV